MKNNVLMTVFVVGVLFAIGFLGTLHAEQEVFWRETATEKIKVIVEEDRVTSRWVFPKKTVHGSKSGLSRLEVGKPFDNSQGMTMAWIPPGSFVMGSDENEAGRDASEGPTRLVTFTAGFWMGINELSQAQYERVMGENPSQSRHSLLPVERVSWKDAVDFCKKLTARERAAGRLPVGFVYRLPTEAEWEYACRAGTEGPFQHEDVLAFAWFSGNSLGKPARIGKKRPNAWGLFDMLGNVSEWCFDGWKDDYTEAPKFGHERLNIVNKEKAYRGGSYADDIGRVRAAARNKAGMMFKHAEPTRGFRCVVAVSK